MEKQLGMEEMFLKALKGKSEMEADLAAFEAKLSHTKFNSQWNLKLKPIQLKVMQ